LKDRKKRKREKIKVVEGHISFPEQWCNHASNPLAHASPAVAARETTHGQWWWCVGTHAATVPSIFQPQF
jgi:hypothetical protein